MLYAKYSKTYIYENGSSEWDSQAHDYCIEHTNLELENVAHEHPLIESELDMIQHGVSRISEMIRAREEIEEGFFTI
jgi:hypothetical protein